MSTKSRLLTILWLFVAWCALPVQANELTPISVAVDYRVQPGDVLLISVWGEQDMKREVLVRPDGGISFPLAGDLMAKDRSVAQIRAELTSKLNKYIPNPAVDVAVGKIAGNKVYVVGKVNKPGEFTVPNEVDVMQALSMAGGTTPFANLDGIKILRRDSQTNEQTVIPFNYKKVSRGENLELNVMLKPGDTVVVP